MSETGSAELRHGDLLVDRPAEHVARVRIDRPHRANAMTADTAAQLAARLRALDADPDVHVVLIGGTGERAFCSGYDLGAVDKGVRDTELQDLLTTLRRLSIPSIGVIDGHAVGAGFDLACSCDLRVARAGVKVGLPAVRIGVAYAAPGLRHIVSVVPAAKRILLTGDLVKSGELPGFADVLIDDGAAEVTREAVDLATRIATAGPASVAYMVEMIRPSSAARYPEDVAFAWRDEILDSDDPAAAARARAGGTTPVFAARRVR